MAQVIIFLFSIAILFSYALQFYVAVEQFLPWLKRQRLPGSDNLKEYSLRTFLVLLTCKFKLGKKSSYSLDIL